LFIRFQNIVFSTSLVPEERTVHYAPACQSGLAEA